MRSLSVTNRCKMHLGLKRNFQLMPGAEWLKLPCKHIPDRYERLVRYCGWYSNRSRWRGWSEVDSSVHYAFYEFDDVARVRATQGSDALKRLAAEFDRLWGDKVTRSRDIVEAIQNIGT